MPQNLSPRPRSNQRLWLWLGSWVGLFIITHVPVVGIRPLSVDHADKFFHFVLYSLLVCLGGRYLFSTRRAVARSTLWGYAGLYGVYAAFDEWLQQFVGRSMSLGDWLADVAGIVLATLWLTLRRR